MAPRELRLRKRVLRWGNSFGIRLTRQDLEELRLKQGAEIDVQVRAGIPKVDWDRLPRFDLGRRASEQVDEILAEGFE